MPEDGALEWVETPCKGTAPCSRTGHSCTVVGLPNNPHAMLFGGITSDGLSNEVWTLKLGAEQLEWKKPKIGQPEQAPSPRWRHTATLMRESIPLHMHNVRERPASRTQRR